MINQIFSLASLKLNKGSKVINRLKFGLIWIILLIFILTKPMSALSTFNIENANCEELAKSLSRNSAIPDGLLASISRVESGRINGSGGKKAWPWTLNLGGDSKFFESKAQTLSFLRTEIKQGKTNIDIGCMQINYRWHKDNFSSIEKMLDPVSNVTYAIRFLNELFEKHKNWEDAVKHYHSATKSLNVKYYRKVARVYSEIKKEQSNEALSFISALPPLAETQVESSHFISLTSEKKGDLSKSGVNEYRSDNSSKSSSHISSESTNSEAIINFSNAKTSEMVDVSISFNREYDLPKAHLPAYIKENWKLVLAMRSILANN